MADDASMQAILAGPAANAPRINLFRAFGNAPSLAPDFMRYFMHLFEPLELDARIERLVVLLVGRESDCEYVWRQNVVVGRSLGVSEEQIAAIYDGTLDAPPFTAKQRAAFQFAKEVIAQIEVTEHGREALFLTRTDRTSLCDRLVHVLVPAGSDRTSPPG